MLVFVFVSLQLTTKPLVRPWVIMVANQKGGVGKTTTAVNLGVELYELGLPVIVIDLDSQGNATDALGIKVEPGASTLYEVLHPDFEKRVPIKDALIASPYGPHVLAGHTAMAAIERDGNGPGGEKSLLTAIENAPGPAIYVVDSPPNLGRLTVMGLVAAGEEPEHGEVLAPVSPGPDELKGLYKLLKTVTGLKANGVAKHLHLGAVLTTEYDGRNQLNRDAKIYLRDTFKDMYFGEISATVRVPEAAARKRPIRHHAPDCTAALDYRTFAQDYAVARGFAERAA